MRRTAVVNVNPREIPEIYVNSTSAQHQTDGRRAGLKIRWGNTRVGSSPTFGTKDLRQIGTLRYYEPGNNLATGMR